MLNAQIISQKIENPKTERNFSMSEPEDELFCDCCGKKMDSDDDTTCEKCIEDGEEYIATASNKGRHE